MLVFIIYIKEYVKKRIYNTIIKRVVTYGYETWKINQKDEVTLEILERKILKKIYDENWVESPRVER